jgi:hypothetical protein
MTYAKLNRTLLGVAALTWGASLGCKHSSPAAVKARPAPALSAVASAATAAALAPSASAAQVDPELASVLQRWNEATNAADGATLAQLYAPQLSLYGRFETNARAVAAKVSARQKEPSFEQAISAVHWDERADGSRQALFDKRSRSAKGEHTVHAYLLLRRFDGKFRIVDEGDRETNAVLKAKADTLSQSWGERFFKCPECTSEDDNRPEAFPPLGPSPVTPGVLAPPGAPAVVNYARLMLVRFASAVDIPTFVTVTPESGNGDGRWFNFAEPNDAGTEPKLLLDCAAGGFWYYGTQPGAPDPSQSSNPELRFTEKTFRDAEGLHYERYIYAPEHIENYVLCKLDPRYEAYFMAIAQRAGRSMRAIGGGMYNRPAHESGP